MTSIAVVIVAGAAGTYAAVANSQQASGTAAPADEATLPPAPSTTRSTTTTTVARTTTTTIPQGQAAQGPGAARAGKRHPPREPGSERLHLRSPPEGAALRSGHDRRLLRPGHAVRGLDGAEVLRPPPHRRDRHGGRLRAHPLPVHTRRAEERTRPRRDRPRQAGAHALQGLAAAIADHDLDRQRRALLRRGRRLPVRHHSDGTFPLLRAHTRVAEGQARDDVEPVLLQRQRRGARLAVGTELPGFARVRPHPDAHRRLLLHARSQRRCRCSSSARRSKPATGTWGRPPNRGLLRRRRPRPRPSPRRRHRQPRRNPRPRPTRRRRRSRPSTRQRRRRTRVRRAGRRRGSSRWWDRRTGRRPATAARP